MESGEDTPQVLSAMTLMAVHDERWGKEKADDSLARVYMEELIFAAESGTGEADDLYYPNMVEALVEASEWRVVHNPIPHRPRLHPPMIRMLTSYCYLVEGCAV